MSIAAAGSSKSKKKEKMPRLSFSDEMNGDEGSEFGGMSQSTNKRYPPRVNVLLLLMRALLRALLHANCCCHILQMMQIIRLAMRAMLVWH